MTQSDVVFLQDLTGSFNDDLPNAKVLIPAVVNRITNPILESVFGADLKVGLASFKDKPVSPLGGSSDYVYRAELGLTDDPTTVGNEFRTFSASGGADIPEAQLDALLYTALDSGGGLGYRAGSSRVAIIATDAAFHKAGDRDSRTSEVGVVPNNGDAVIDPLEDYVSIPELKTTLEANNITPVFLATSGQQSTYEGLVNDLGRGGVVTLDLNSENVADGIKQAIGVARGVITQPESPTDFLIVPPGTSDEVIFAGDGDDIVSLNGVVGDHFIDGGAGSDQIFSFTGDDTLDGGSGKDSLSGGEGNDILFGSFGDDIISGLGGDDFLQGDSGNDVLTGDTGADTFAFDTGGKFVSDELGIDNITDFKSSEGDKIRLSKDTFTELSNTLFPTALDSAGFDTVEGFDFNQVETSEAEIVYFKTFGSLFYNPNGADAGFDKPLPEGGFAEGGQFATLTAAPTLAATDFEVVQAS